MATRGCACGGSPQTGWLDRNRGVLRRQRLGGGSVERNEVLLQEPNAEAARRETCMQEEICSRESTSSSLGKQGEQGEAGVPCRCACALAVTERGGLSGGDWGRLLIGSDLG